MQSGEPSCDGFQGYQDPHQHVRTKITPWTTPDRNRRVCVLRVHTRTLSVILKKIGRTIFCTQIAFKINLCYAAKNLKPQICEKKNYQCFLKKKRIFKDNKDSKCKISLDFLNGFLGVQNLFIEKKFYLIFANTCYKLYHWFLKG